MDGELILDRTVMGSRIVMEGRVDRSMMDDKNVIDVRIDGW